MKGTVKIPRSELSAMIAQTAEAHLRATKLLLELEESYLGTKVEKVGGWRQDTSSWLKPKN